MCTCWFVLVEFMTQVKTEESVFELEKFECSQVTVNCWFGEKKQFENTKY